MVKIAIVSAMAISTASAEQTTYRTFIAQPSEVHLFWLNPSGERFGQLKQLYDFLSEKSYPVEMLMNGGIFEPEGIPSGLCIINGEILRPLRASYAH